MDSVSAQRAIGLAFAAVATTAFSLRPIFIKLAYVYDRDPVTLIALRMGFALPFFFAVVLWDRRRTGFTPLSWRDRLSAAGLGVIGYYCASFFDFLGLQYISAGLGRLMLFAYPTIVVILSAVVFKRPIRRRELASLGITYIGLALTLAAATGGGENVDIVSGALLLLGSAACYAVYLVGGGEMVRRLGSVRFTTVAMIAASTICILQFVALRPIETLSTIPAIVYGYMIAVGVGCTVLPAFLMVDALRRIGANEVALLGALGPVVSIFVGWLVLNEGLSAIQIFGSALVLGGVMLVSLRKS